MTVVSKAKLKGVVSGSGLVIFAWPWPCLGVLWYADKNENQVMQIHTFGQTKVKGYKLYTGSA